MTALQPPPIVDFNARQPFNLRKWLTTPNDSYAVGTIKYTGFGLIMVFVWLLWGDFIFTLLDGNVPGILPLKLNDLGAGDMTNQVLNKTFAYAVAFLFAPVVSFRSDRTRTRLGRRIPYLLWSTPFVGLFLIGMGCYESLTHVITGGAASVTILGFHLSQQAVTIAVFGALIIGWDFANIFVNTVYWYLFNDVVPQQYMSRFMSLFRVVGTFSGMAYSAWIFPYSLSHFRLIFVIAGVAYLIGFLLMCFFVREGSYPPPPPNVDGQRGLVSSIKTYAKECFTHRLYIYFYLANACTFMCGLTGTFTNIRNTKVLGLTLVQIGMVRVWKDGAALVLHLPAGYLSDRFHPLRTYVVTHILYICSTLAACVWVFRDFGPEGNFRYYFWITLLFEPFYALANAAEIPMYMRLLPKERYGQFCSANGMVRAFTMIFGSVAAAGFIQYLGHHVGMRRYCWIPVWTLVFQLAAAVFLILLYRQWKRHGGMDNYTPPGMSEDSCKRAFPVLPVRH